MVETSELLVVSNAVEVSDEDCALDGMDDGVRPVDSDIAEADDEVMLLP